ncbi:MAG: hypothetical protein ACREJU_20480 [Nitrospiraceae bacterium]
MVKPQFERLESQLDRPSRILVYDFAVTEAQVKENQGLLQGTVNDFQGTTTYQHMGELADEVRNPDEWSDVDAVGFQKHVVDMT